MSESMASSIATLRSSSVSESQPSSCTTMPLVSPSLAAGAACASVWVEPPPAVALNGLLQVLGGRRHVVQRRQGGSSPPDSVPQRKPGRLVGPTGGWIPPPYDACNDGPVSETPATTESSATRPVIHEGLPT